MCKLMLVSKEYCDEQLQLLFSVMRHETEGS